MPISADIKPERFSRRDFLKMSVGAGLTVLGLGCGLISGGEEKKTEEQTPEATATPPKTPMGMDVINPTADAWETEGAKAVEEGHPTPTFPTEIQTPSWVDP